MFSNSNCASVPLVANIDGNGNNGGWADGGWLWIIVVFALLFGWGNGGFGGFGGTELFLNKFEELSEKIGQLEDRFDKSLGTQRKSSRTQSKGGDEE